MLLGLCPEETCDIADKLLSDFVLEGTIVGDFERIRDVNCSWNLAPVIGEGDVVAGLKEFDLAFQSILPVVEPCHRSRNYSTKRGDSRIMLKGEWDVPGTNLLNGRMQGRESELIPVPVYVGCREYAS